MIAIPAPRWVVAPIPEPAVTEQLARELNLPRALAAVLVQRGFTQPDRARSYLRPSLAELSDPFALDGMSAAVGIISGAVQRGETILVHGDYDVDGQCSTAILTRTLRQAGASVVAFVPHRLRDGYDFGPAGLARAQECGAALIITADCGITAVDTVAQANLAGIRVVVTDHHLPGPVVPSAAAIIDPQLRADPGPAGVLCGAGIAWKLVQALAPVLKLPAAWPLYLLDLVALATVADVVPLTGENRILVRHGLRLMRASRWIGLQALIEACGMSGRDIRSGQLGFILGPRLNAAGRIGDAKDGLQLLLTEDPAEAAVLAERLEQLNTSRQALDQQILLDAIEQVETDPAFESSPTLVLGADGWHPGVVGIVASRIVERYGRPTFLVGFEGEIGKGSGRSISGFDLHAALQSCGDLLERYGGHRMAAGLTVRRNQFEAFRERFREVASRTLGPSDLGPEQRVDLELSLEDAHDDLERLCRHLEPCGSGNPSPVFGVRGARFAGWSVIGNGHLKGNLEQGGRRLAAIGFQLADRVPWLGTEPVDVAFRLERNEWRGTSSLQARLVALAPHQPAQAASAA